MKNFQVELYFGKLRVPEIYHGYPIPFHRERPAAIPIEIKSIDDTSNFDDFPESDILQPGKTAYSTTLLKVCEDDDIFTNETPLLLVNLSSAKYHRTGLQIQRLGFSQLYL